jgi:hypothetical protein
MPAKTVLIGNADLLDQSLYVLIQLIELFLHGYDEEILGFNAHFCKIFFCISGSHRSVSFSVLDYTGNADK